MQNGEFGGHLLADWMFELGKLGLVHAVGYSAFITPARHTALAETLFLQRFLSLAQPGACLVFFFFLHCIALRLMLVTLEHAIVSSDFAATRILIWDFCWDLLTGAVLRFG